MGSDIDAELLQRRRIVTLPGINWTDQRDLMPVGEAAEEAKVALSVPVGRGCRADGLHPEDSHAKSMPPSPSSRPVCAARLRHRASTSSRYSP